jgi:hypothetical protein
LPTAETSLHNINASGERLELALPRDRDCVRVCSVISGLTNREYLSLIVDVLTAEEAHNSQDATMPDEARRHHPDYRQILTDGGSRDFDGA